MRLEALGPVARSEALAGTGIGIVSGPSVSAGSIAGFVCEGVLGVGVGVGVAADTASLRTAVR
jgi:hypothetical protein